MRTLLLLTFISGILLCTFVATHPQQQQEQQQQKNQTRPPPCGPPPPNGPRPSGPPPHGPPPSEARGGPRCGPGGPSDTSATSSLNSN